MRLPRRGRPRRRGRAARAGAARRVRRGVGAVRSRRRGARSRRDPRPDRLAAVPRRGLAPFGLGRGRPGEALLGARAGRGGARRPDPRAHARRRDRAPRRRRGPGHRAGCGPRPPGPARDQRLPGAASAHPAARGSGLGLRAGHRAAERRAARGDRLGRRPGARRHGEPLPLLAPDRRRAHPLGRLRRDLLLRQRDRTRAPVAGADLRRPRRPLLRRLPAARGDPLQPPVGRRDRHLLALLRLLRDRARGTGLLRARPYRSRRRRQPLRRRGIARPARGPPRPRSRGCGRSARSRSRSRPSRCAGRRSSSPATGSRRPTGGAAAAGSGCGPWTRSGSASTASRSPRRSAASRAYRAARPSRAGS